MTNERLAYHPGVSARVHRYPTLFNTYGKVSVSLNVLCLLWGQQ